MYALKMIHVMALKRWDNIENMNLFGKNEQDNLTIHENFNQFII